MTVQLKDRPSQVLPQTATQAAFRTILLHVQDNRAALPRLDSAVGIADRLGATLVGLGAEGIDPMVYSDGYGLSGGWIGDYQAAVAADLERARVAFEERAAGISHRWEACQADPLPMLCELARSADLLIAGAGPAHDRGQHRYCDTGQLTLESGRPVLVVPEGGGRLRATAVVVAWKDTRESRRALSDALPFLKDAEEVLIVEVCSRDEVADAEARLADLCSGLKRHGVTAKSAVRVAHPAAVAFELNTAADAFGADLIVAGAYGHSRLGEWVFGGVTRELVSGAERFLLLSH